MDFWSYSKGYNQQSHCTVHFLDEAFFFSAAVSGAAPQVSPEPQQPPLLSIDSLIAEKNPFFFFSSAIIIHLNRFLYSELDTLHGAIRYLMMSTIGEVLALPKVDTLFLFCLPLLLRHIVPSVSRSCPEPSALPPARCHHPVRPKVA